MVRSIEIFDLRSMQKPTLYSIRNSGISNVSVGFPRFGGQLVKQHLASAAVGCLVLGCLVPFAVGVGARIPAGRCSLA